MVCLDNPWLSMAVVDIVGGKVDVMVVVGLKHRGKRKESEKLGIKRVMTQ
jgi:hypothetical protein